MKPTRRRATRTMPLAVALLGCCALLLLPCSLACAQDDAGNADQAEQAKRWAQLEKLIEQSPKPKTVRAEFEQVRTSLLLDEPVVSKGRFVSAGDVCRWSLGKPAAMEVRTDSKRMQIYYRDDNVLEVYPIPEQGLPLASQRPDLERLAKNFDLRVLKQDEAEVQITLEARGEMREHLISLDLLFDREAGTVKRVTTVDPAGDKTVMSLKAIETDEKIEPDELKLKVPENARVVKPAEQG